MSGNPRSTGVRRRAKRGEGELLRDHILDAAQALLIETGNEDAVSIRAVAQRTGVTPPAIYLHFGDKDDLMFEVCERQFLAIDAVMEEAAEAATDPLHGLYLRGRAYVSFGLEHPESYRIMFMQRSRTEADAEREERMINSASFNRIVAAVRLAMEADLIVNDDAELIATGLWVTVHGLTSLLISQCAFARGKEDDLIDYVLSMAVAGLMTPKARASKHSAFPR